MSGRARFRFRRRLVGSQFLAIKPMSDERIKVAVAGDNEWLVVVEGAATTRHQVRATPLEIVGLAHGQAAEALIEESFRFLLEREPNTSILSSFGLLQIGRYFPEYEAEIRRRMQQRG
jgi:hypothetical protein